MIYTLQQLANAMPIASLYAALAYGYSLTFALTKRADLTYGALFAFSGHLFLLGSHAGWNVFLLTFAASLGAGVLLVLLVVLPLGILVGRYLVSPLAEVSPNALTVASLGLLLSLMEIARLVSNTQELWLPPFLNSPLSLATGSTFEASITELQLLISLVLVCGILACHLSLKGSRSGREWRAVSEDRVAARFCGVNVDAVCVRTYILSALIAATGGILATMLYGTMGFAAGLIFGLKVVLIAGVGGYFHPLRSAMGAAAIGLLETFWSGFAPLIWRDVAVLVVLTLFLVWTRQEKSIA